MKAVKIIALLFAAWLVLYVGLWEFTICRVWVDEDEILVVQQKMAGKANEKGELLVPEGTIGIWKRVFTTGRYFFNPLVYHVEKFPILEIPANKVGVVTAKTGEDLPPGEFLAEPHQKGIWRNVLTAGRYAINPKGYTVKLESITHIPTGYVGCITTLSGRQPEDGKLAGPDEKGIQQNVLNPGLYAINPLAVKVDVVGVGFDLLNLTNVEFPSADGFRIQLDTSVVWGLLPEDVPYIIHHFGDYQAMVDKIINPQVTSICMLEGSKLGAREFIDGDSREAFQSAFTAQLKKICAEKRTNVRICLVRDINIPSEIKDPIQQAFLNVELKLTKDEQKQTARVKSELQTLISEVEKGKAEVMAETERMMRNLQAEGERTVAQMMADAEVKIAVIDRDIAEINAKRDLILGGAKALAREMVGKAKSDKFRQLVGVFGNAQSYVSWSFANSLPKDMSIDLRYSGEGTLWTDADSGLPLANDLTTLKQWKKK